MQQASRKAEPGDYQPRTQATWEEGKVGLVSTVCACAKNPTISWGMVYHRLRTVNLYRIPPKHVRLGLIPRTAGKK